MADVFLLIKSSLEQQRITEYIQNTTAYLSDDNLYIHKFSNLDASLAFINKDNKLDFAIIEVIDKKGIEFLVKFREINPNVELMLLVKSTISPMQYITPKIRASALLLVPYDEGLLESTITDYLSDYYNRRENISDEKTYVINTKNGKEFIPFSSVYYVEVREKRIYIRLQNREYSQFGTLENVLKAFPDNFLRCHRSYAFNTKFLNSIKFSENIIFLLHGISVPLSRSYKKKVKEYLSGTKI